MYFVENLYLMSMYPLRSVSNRQSCGNKERISNSPIKRQSLFHYTDDYRYNLDA